MSCLYVWLNAGVDCFAKLFACKERICELHAELADGVQVCVRMEEHVDCERLFPFLLWREKAAMDSVHFKRLHQPDDSVLYNMDGVVLYVRQELEALYGELQGDVVLADSFLRGCALGLSVEDCSMLVRDVLLSELLGVVQFFWSRRVPGSYGLPLEFYITFWDVVGEFFLEVVRSCLQGCFLPESQYDGFVQLLPKPGDLSFFF